ncbi:MAG: hypothetical protein ACXWJN_04440 [Methyloceanibacter sp.]
MAKSTNAKGNTQGTDKWSAEVMAHDHPFDLEPGLFADGSAQ